MKRFLTLKNIVLVWLVVYAFVAQVIIPINDFDEVFPFFHWSLFSRRLDHHADYTIKIELANGDRCYFKECPSNRYIYKKRIYFIIQDAAKEFADGSFGDGIDLLAKHIRKNFSGAKSFQIVSREFKILEFYRNPSSVKRRTIGEAVEL